MARATGIKHLVAVLRPCSLRRETVGTRRIVFRVLSESMACVHGHGEREGKRGEKVGQTGRPLDAQRLALERRRWKTFDFEKKMYINKYENVFFF